MKPLRKPPRILLIRRDNIGDLVLTTPLISALRAAQADAWIGVLANSYNAAVLDGNPHLDAVYAYDKAKHRPDVNRLAIYAATARTLWQLRRMRIDWLILAGPAPQRQALTLARWIAPQRVVGFVTSAFSPAALTHALPYGGGTALHETQDVFRLLAPLGIAGEIPRCAVHADADRVAALRATLGAVPDDAAPIIGIQISARRLRQRWPVGRFVELIVALHARHRLRFRLFWAPGTADDVRHPGDDAMAVAFAKALPPGIKVVARPTASVPDLIAGLSLVDLLITPDGGAMHLAAGLGKPVIALFGDAPAARWHPWGVPHEIVQAPDGDVATLAVPAVLSAWERLAPRVFEARLGGR